MARQEVEEKIVEIAHDFAKKYGEEVLQLTEDELIAHIGSNFDYQSWLIFKHNQYEMLKLFVKTVKEDLSKS